MSNKPLEGVRVIDLTYFIAGPGAGRMLADWGADVIKIEPAFGDPGRTTGAPMTCPTYEGANPLYTTYNANKRCISMNLKSPEGKAIMDELLSGANVLLTSYRTGALERLGLDYESLCERHPHLIWAQVIGFGTRGPAKDKPGFDTVAFWARSGAMFDIPEKGSGPINPPIGFGDSCTSSTLAAGICAALYQQAKKGVGQKILVSLFGQAIWSMSALMSSCQYQDEYPKTRKNAVSPVIDSFMCKDGRWVFLSILEHDRYYNKLMEVFGREDLMDDPRFAKAADGKRNAEELIRILDGEFIKYTQDEIVEMLTKADIAHERIQQTKDVMNDAQALENYYLTEWTNRDGTVTKLPSTPVQFGQADPNPIHKDAPLVGQDSVEILKELGYADEHIQGLIDSGVVYIAPPFQK